jgi:hypothetical protein
MLNKKRILIFIRAFLIVTFSTVNIYLISNKHYALAILSSIAISTMWTLNISALCISNNIDRAFYVTGATLGTSLSLIILTNI